MGAMKTAWMIAAIVGVVLPMTDVSAKQIKVIAHRGDSFHCPENTLAAFNSGLDKNADLIELDAHATKDGVLVVIHDGELDRTTNSVAVLGLAKARVADASWSQIQGLDAGSWKSPQFSGEHIVTLEEALKCIQARGVTLLEHKAGSALEYAKLLKKLGYTRDLVIQSFDWDFIAAMKTWLPEARLGALWHEDVTAERLAFLTEADIPLAVWSHKKINETAMKLFRDAGLELWVYTVNEPAQWRRLVDLGVDGMITDKPGELIEWLKAEGLR